VRTTLTLDDDVAAKLKAEVRRSGRPFKELVNDLLRVALSSRRQPPPAAPFRVQARPLGVRPGLDYDRISHLIDQIDGPSAR
jgi:hypothetical protein